MSDLKTLTIYGASDDLVELSGYIVEEYDALYEAVLLLVTAPDGARIAVEAEFGPPEAFCEEWRVTVHHFDVDWIYPVRFGVRPGRNHDPAVELDVPEGTTVTRWGGDQR